MTQASKVFKIRYAEGFEWLLPIESADFDRLRFDGSWRAASWTPVRMRRLRTAEGQPLKPSDFPACSGGDMLVVSHDARAKLGEEFERVGELLPLECEDGEFWAVNVTRLLDALNERESQVLRFPDGDRIMMIRKAVFRPERLEGAQLFKLSRMERGLIYVTESFVSRVTASGLKGIEFDQVWESA